MRDTLIRSRVVVAMVEDINKNIAYAEADGWELVEATGFSVGTTGHKASERVVLRFARDNTPRMIPLSGHAA